MGDEEERERESEKEGRMTWTSVGAEIMTWRCLEKKKKILSASAFNLYYRYYRYRCNVWHIGIHYNCHEPRDYFSSLI
jgi:hypothetical protein